jgi:hypothetical protein
MNVYLNKRPGKMGNNSVKYGSVPAGELTVKH